MTAEALLTDLLNNGFSLSAANGLLHVKPSVGMTDQQRASIRANKAELIQLLTPKPCAKCSTPMERIEFGYQSCPNCHFQRVEPRSGFWMATIEQERRAA